MKHLILQDHELYYMVYYRPKDKVRLYETLFSIKQEKAKYPVLINHITQCLQLVGFKVVDISQEIKNITNVNYDISSDYIMYRGLEIGKIGGSFNFKINNRYTTTLTLEEAIKIIDKEGK